MKNIITEFSYTIQWWCNPSKFSGAYPNFKAFKKSIKKNSMLINCAFNEMIIAYSFT